MLDEFYKELEEKYETGDSKVIEDFLLESTKKHYLCCGKTDDVQIAIFNELGQFYLSSGRIKEAIDNFNQAKNFVATLCGGNSLEYANITNNLANAYRISGNADEALKEYKAALMIYKEVGSTEGYFYSSALNNIAIIYMQKKMYTEAKDALTSALEITEGKDELMQERAVALTNMGSLFMFEGEDEKAMDYIKQSIALYDKLPDEKRVNLAAAYNTLGDLFFKQDEVEEALSAYVVAKNLTLQFFGKNIEYIIACRKLAVVYEKQKKFDKRDDKIKEALAVMESLNLKNTKFYEDTKNMMK